MQSNSSSVLIVLSCFQKVGGFVVVAYSFYYYSSSFFFLAVKKLFAKPLFLLLILHMTLRSSAFLVVRGAFWKASERLCAHVNERVVVRPQTASTLPLPWGRQDLASPGKLFLCVKNTTDRLDDGNLLQLVYRRVELFPLLYLSTTQAILPRPFFFGGFWRCWVLKR